jgi:hypothetical protein
VVRVLAWPHHNSGFFLEAVWLEKRLDQRSGAPLQSGWYVRRTCRCHAGVIVTRRFDTQDQALGCIAVMEAVHQQLEGAAA